LAGATATPVCRWLPLAFVAFRITVCTFTTMWPGTLLHTVSVVARRPEARG